MSDKHILAIVFSENCGACKSFKANQLETLKTKLRGVVELAKIETSDFTLHPGEYPVGLKSYVAWFPSFILVARKSWEERLKSDQSNDLEASIFAGVIDKDGRVVQIPGQAFTAENVSKWVETELAKNPKFGSSQKIVEVNKAVERQQNKEQNKESCTGARFRGRNY